MSGEQMLEVLANDILDLEALAERDQAFFNDENLAPAAVPALQNDNQRFQTVSIEDSVDFIKNHENKNTSSKTRSDLKIFNDWKLTVNEDRVIEEIPSDELDGLLARFFLSIRKKDGSEYEPDSVTSIQYSIERHLKEKRVGFSIVKDPAFAHSNNVLVSKRKNLKSQGKGNLKSKSDPLTKEEIGLLREKGLLGNDDPEKLLNSVWLNNGVYFAMRGRQDHTNLLWGDLELKTAADNREYLEFTERSTKTRNGAKRNSARALTPKTFARPEQGDLCPVALYKAYKKHRPDDMLNDNSRFYLQPLQNPKSDVWYSKQPCGKNKLGKIMSQLATKAELQGRHTNHATRKTFCQTLVHAGYAPTEVAQLGGWRNLQSITNYSTPSLEMQANDSDYISNVMLPATTTATSAAKTSTISLMDSNLSPSVSDAQHQMHVMSNNLELESSNSVSTVSKQNSNPLAVLCGANVSGGTVNINIFTGKRKFTEISGSQESQ